MKHLLPIFISVLGLSVLIPEKIRAQTYPERAVTLIVPYAPDGPTYAVARLMAEGFQQRLGQSFTVETITGAGGTLGTAEAAKAKPDGYTLLVHHLGHALAPLVYSRLPYDPVRDFAPVGLVAETRMTMVGRPGLPAETLSDLIALVRREGRNLTYAHSGAGGASHLCGMLFLQTAQVQATAAAYRGTAPALNDLMIGRVDFLCNQLVSSLEPIRRGQVKAYGITSATRSPALPDVPTMAEAGLPGFEISIWHGLYAPAGTPASVIARLTETLQQMLRSPPLTEAIIDAGAEPMMAADATPARLAAKLAAEMTRWRPVVLNAGDFAD
jgi:tripartite-type tricarboxylate transporter receptor subunit TctC